MRNGTRVEDKQMVYASICLIKMLYRKGEISEKQYNTIVKKYGTAA